MLEEPDDGVKACYIRDWRRLLKEFFEWSDPQIEQWIQSKSEILRNPLLDHEHPSWYVVHLVLTEPEWESLGRERIPVRHRIAFILESFEDAHPPYEEIRRRIREVLAEYAIQWSGGVCR